MNFRRFTTSMAIALMVVSLISTTSIQQEAFAAGRGMSITATADKGSDIITVTGKTVSHITDVTLSVTSPSGSNIVNIDQISPDDNGDFMTEFKIDKRWTEDGFYTITVMQGVQQNSLFTLEIPVEITNQMAERISVTESNLETGLFVSKDQNATKNRGLEIYADAIEGSTTIEITGSTDRINQDITLTVTAPNANVITADQISPNLDGEFTSVIEIGGPLWKQDGDYTITAQQFVDPKYTASTIVEIQGGAVIPEFGAIAAMILAVAIISIIAISARSRLSIMPRY